MNKKNNRQVTTETVVRQLGGRLAVAGGGCNNFG